MEAAVVRIVEAKESNSNSELAVNSSCERMYELLCFAEGTGVVQDVTQATRWYTKASEGGDVGALFSLGLLCLDKEPQDLMGAVEWWRRAAAAGHGPAMIALVNLRDTVRERAGPPQPEKAAK